VLTKVMSLSPIVSITNAANVNDTLLVVLETHLFQLQNVAFAGALAS
jgi:hypothetical protein